MRLPTVDFLYNGGAVKRFHTMPTIKENTVATHSFGVAWMCYLLTGGTAGAALILSALAHDLAEQQVGDVPSPTKRALDICKALGSVEDNILKENGTLFLLNEAEERTLKMADCFDGMMFCVQEALLGNTHARVVYSRYQSYVDELGPLNKHEQAVLDQINVLAFKELVNV